MSSSPVLEDTGCGLIALTVGSPPSLASKPSNVVKLLVGSKHHFDLVRIDLGQNGSGNDSTRILTLASGSSTGAISATEVSWIKDLGCTLISTLRSVRPKPNVRPKFSAKLAEIFGRKFRPACRIFGHVKLREIWPKIYIF